MKITRKKLKLIIENYLFENLTEKQIDDGKAILKEIAKTFYDFYGAFKTIIDEVLNDPKELKKQIEQLESYISQEAIDQSIEYIDSFLEKKSYLDEFYSFRDVDKTIDIEVDKILKSPSDLSKLEEILNKAPNLLENLKNFIKDIKQILNSNSNKYIKFFKIMILLNKVGVDFYEWSINQEDNPDLVIMEMCYVFSKTFDDIINLPEDISNSYKKMLKSLGGDEIDSNVNKSDNIKKYQNFSNKKNIINTRR